MNATAKEGTGTAQRVAPWIAVVIALILSALGYAYTQGQVVSAVTERLDRNCRILASIEANSRFLIVQHAAFAAGNEDPSEAEAFRAIFERAVTETC